MGPNLFCITFKTIVIIFKTIDVCTNYFQIAKCGLQGVEVVKDCDVWLANFHQNNSSNNDKLNGDDIIVLGAIQQLHFYLNEALQSNDKKRISAWNDYISFLQSALAKLPDTAIVTYIGVDDL